MNGGRQYVAVRFTPNARRTYTYHNDGEPVAIGDRVRIDGPEGFQTVEVVALPDRPNFATKPISDKAPEERPADDFRDYVEDVRSGLRGPDLFGDS